MLEHYILYERQSKGYPFCVMTRNIIIIRDNFAVAVEKEDDRLILCGGIETAANNDIVVYRYQ